MDRPNSVSNGLFSSSWMDQIKRMRTLQKAFINHLDQGLSNRGPEGSYSKVSSKKNCCLYNITLTISLTDSKYVSVNTCVAMHFRKGFLARSSSNLGHQNFWKLLVLNIYVLFHYLSGQVGQSTLVGYMALEGKASREVISVYLRSMVFLVAGQ